MQEIKKWWKKVKLEKLINYPTWKLDSNAMIEGGIYPYFTCSQEVFKIDEYAFDQEAILLWWNNASWIFPLKYYKWKFNAYQRTYVMSSKDEELLNNKFFYYYLTPLLSQFKSMSTWATTKFLTKKMLDKLELNIPPLPTQKKIASILSKYDDLIENNNKRIKILEETAQSIYEEWFVKYNFPWSENIKMIDSGNDDFGMIPEGWEIWSILDIDYFRFIRENIKEYEWEKVYYATADIDWICITWKWENFDFNSKPSRAQKEPILNSVWFARMIETFKVLWFTQTNEEIANRSILSSWMVWFEAEEYIFPFLYYTINSKDFHSIKNLYCTWATQRALTNDWLKQIKIIYPNKNIVENYWKLTKSMINEMFLLQKQNQNLKEIRDLLIPRLVSGELDVESLDVK